MKEWNLLRLVLSCDPAKGMGIFTWIEILSKWKHMFINQNQVIPSHSLLPWQIFHFYCSDRSLLRLSYLWVSRRSFPISNLLSAARMNEVNRFCSPDRSRLLLYKSACRRINLWDVLAALCLCLLANKGSIYHLWGQRIEVSGLFFPTPLIYGVGREAGHFWVMQILPSTRGHPTYLLFILNSLFLAVRGNVESVSKSAA